VQVYGKKKWVLYPAGDRIFLDARTERRPYYFSNVIPDAGPDKQLPLQHLASKREVILEPGDILWVPPFVWHYIENLSDSIGVSYKYANFSSSLKSSRMLTLLFLFTTKPSIIYSFFVTRIKKDDYVLTKKSS
jgi:lysine-specific demethylase 8